MNDSYATPGASHTSRRRRPRTRVTVRRVWGLDGTPIWEVRFTRTATPGEVIDPPPRPAAQPVSTGPDIETAFAAIVGAESWSTQQDLWKSPDQCPDDRA